MTHNKMGLLKVKTMLMQNAYRLTAVPLHMILALITPDDLKDLGASDVLDIHQTQEAVRKERELDEMFAAHQGNGRLTEFDLALELNRHFPGDQEIILTLA